MPELDGVIEAARRLVERAEATAEPIAADTSLSVEGRVAKVREADEATLVEFTKLEDRVRAARESAEEEAKGATIEGVDPASVRAGRESPNVDRI